MDSGLVGGGPVAQEGQSQDTRSFRNSCPPTKRYHSRWQREGEMRSRLEILEEIAKTARNYHELYQPGDGRNTIASQLAWLFTELDQLES